MMRSEWDTNLLPEPPKEPGWHYCWLSTTSSTDPIYRRIQRGYELVRSEHLKGWNQLRVSQGEYEGFVGCNEMILSRIPEELYQEAMRYFHHELPLAEEGRIREQALEERQVQDSKGHDLIMGEASDDAAGFDLVTVEPMPANNLSLVFRRIAPAVAPAVAPPARY